jgi:DNA repair exonuclease SbcCD ATPase subunit
MQADYKARLERELAGYQPQAAPLGGSAEQRYESFRADLALIRERNLTARRLELEKDMRARVEAERQRVDQELAAYEDQLMRADQQEKLNLQLQMQVAKTPEEEAAVQEKLEDIGQREAQAKEARRQELYAQLEQLQSQEEARLKQEMASYQARLDAEAQAKLTAERRRLAGMAPAAAPAAPADVQAKINQVRAQMEAEMNARKGQMEAEMRAQAEQATLRLKKKKDEIEGRLEELSAELQKSLEPSDENLSAGTRQRMQAVEAQIQTLEAERQRIYDQIAADLRDKVGGVARKQRVQLVIGEFVVNNGCPDLTDLSMLAIRKTR